jgi:hypothetical protein
VPESISSSSRSWKAGQALLDALERIVVGQGGQRQRSGTRSAASGWSTCSCARPAAWASSRGEPVPPRALCAMHGG